MIYPTPEQLSNEGKYNRYTLVIASAKCARVLTDEYVEQRAEAEKLIANKETDKSIAAQLRKEIRDEKAVTLAVNHLRDGEYVICDDTVPENTTM